MGQLPATFAHRFSRLVQRRKTLTDKETLCSRDLSLQTESKTSQSCAPEAKSSQNKLANHVSWLAGAVAISFCLEALFSGAPNEGKPISDNPTHLKLIEIKEFNAMVDRLRVSFVENAIIQFQGQIPRQMAAVLYSSMFIWRGLKSDRATCLERSGSKIPGGQSLP